MTIRNPLVRISGKIIDLPAGDAIGGASQGPVGMTWQGTWNGGTSYVVDDAVEHNGSAYIAIQAGTNQTPNPAGTAYWDLLASKGDTGATGATGPTGPAGTSGFVKIAQVVTSSSQSTITFSSIANTYTDLLITISGRDTAAGSSDLSVRMKINSDGTSSNYDSTQYLLGQGTSASANAQAATSDGGICCQIPGSQNNANAVGFARILIPNYKGTVFHKGVLEDSMEIHSATPTRLKIQRGFVWKSTAAITDIVLKAGGTAFVDGTTATLYGMG